MVSKESFRFDSESLGPVVSGLVVVSFTDDRLGVSHGFEGAASWDTDPRGVDCTLELGDGSSGFGVVSGLVVGSLTEDRLVVGVVSESREVDSSSLVSNDLVEEEGVVVSFTEVRLGEGSGSFTEGRLG